MRETIVNLFTEYALIWVFLHVISAIIWTGGMILMRVSVIPVLALIEDEKIRIAKTIRIFKSFFQMVTIAIILIFISAIVMIIGQNFKATDLQPIVALKETILVVMIVVFSFAYVHVNKAENKFVSGDIEASKEHISKVKLAILVNLPLSIIVVILGITLRGF